MENKITTWLKAAIVFQLLTSAIHSLSFLRSPQGKNETEKQLLDLMYNYKMDMGAGFHRSMGEIFTSVSFCFTMIFLLGGLLNFYMIRKKASDELLKGFVGIQALVFGAVFIMAVLFAFLPPATFTGIVFILLAISYFRLGAEPKKN
jgi:uncharacterized membrane protein HdeD (DUF308 family)